MALIIFPIKRIVLIVDPIDTVADPEHHLGGGNPKIFETVFSQTLEILKFLEKFSILGQIDDLF